MTSIRLRQLIGSLQKIAWVIFLFVLPITSFPYIPAEFGGRTLVRQDEQEDHPGNLL